MFFEDGADDGGEDQGSNDDGEAKAGEGDEDLAIMSVLKSRSCSEDRWRQQKLA